LEEAIANYWSAELGPWWLVTFYVYSDEPWKCLALESDDRTLASTLDIQSVLGQLVPPNGWSTATIINFNQMYTDCQSCGLVIDFDDLGRRLNQDDSPGRRLSSEDAQNTVIRRIQENKHTGLLEAAIRDGIGTSLTASPPLAEQSAPVCTWSNGLGDDTRVAMTISTASDMAATNHVGWALYDSMNGGELLAELKSQVEAVGAEIVDSKICAKVQGELTVEVQIHNLNKQDVFTEAELLPMLRRQVSDTILDVDVEVQTSDWLNGRSLMLADVSARLPDDSATSNTACAWLKANADTVTLNVRKRIAADATLKEYAGADSISVPAVVCTR